MTPEDVYREVNRVQPSLIRVEADEVTYNLHILIRFELELALMRGQLEVADLPGDVGRPPTIAASACARPMSGVACCRTCTGRRRSFGYFPTYTLGQPVLGHPVGADRDRPSGHRRGSSGRAEFAPLLDWLRTRIHRPGYIQEGDDLIHKVTGSRLQHAPFMRYLWASTGPLYGLEAPA